MLLAPGEKLGHYEILSLIGKGGMGEVYKARDPRVGRDVAIKVSAQQFSERFDREAKAIAALNHPNICTLYDVGPNYLVMEFVEGESPKGPLPVEEALRIAEQIALALEAAHEKNITHRDLKPGNVIIRPDGTVKVLDFGLAKVGRTSTSDGDATLTLGGTVQGAVLGTPAYMAPEQARGKEADRRADIWAFGVVLYELITGKRLFQGDDLTDILASVVKEQPDLSAVPTHARLLIEECLKKDPSKRLQAIGDRRLLLHPPAPPVMAGVTKNVSRLPWTAAAVLAVAAAVALWAPWRTPPAPEQVRFEINAPPETTFTNWMALSPDGKMVAFTARRKDGQVRLWVRPIDSLEAKDIANTSGNPVPFWSPDSRNIAYQLEGKLRRVEASGGPSQVLCDVNPNFGGGAWSHDGVIVFGGPDGLQRVSANGGAPQKLTVSDSSKGETLHAAPVFLPDGKRFLYQRRASSADNTGIYVGSLDDAPEKQSTKLLLATGLNALFTATPSGGRLLFARENALMAQPFDAAKAELTGEAEQIANPVGRMTGAWINAMTADNGALIYRTGGLVETRHLIWHDREGKALSSLPEAGSWGDIALSRDGTRAAAARQVEGGTVDVFVVDLAKALFTRFTFDKAVDSGPVWSPDGNRIVFASERDGVRNLYIKASNGATNEELLLKSPQSKTPTDWSGDGQFLLYTVAETKSGSDVWVLPMSPANGKSGETKPTPFLSTQFNEDQAHFSPDGRFVAYRSNESGRDEIYVRSFPDGSGKWQISRNGGAVPRWSGDGKELYFHQPTGVLLSVDVTLATEFRFGTEKRLFSPRTGIVYDVAADGKRFLLADALDNEAAANPIIVVLNALK